MSVGKVLQVGGFVDVGGEAGQGSTGWLEPSRARFVQVACETLRPEAEVEVAASGQQYRVGATAVAVRGERQAGSSTLSHEVVDLGCGEGRQIGVQDEDFVGAARD